MLRSRGQVGLALAVAASGLWVGAAAASALQGDTALVSASTDADGAEARSYLSSISADGRYVAFASDADDIAGRVWYGGSLQDVFLRDTVTKTTKRVSVPSGSVNWSPIVLATGDSSDPSVSTDGRYVAFFSGAKWLITNDTNALGDVFVRDMVAGSNSRVSIPAAGGQGNGPSYDPSISSTGRFVSFESDATNLVSGDTNGHRDVFVRDRTGATTKRASVSITGGSANGASHDSAISPDGRYVAFISAATNLVPGDTNGREDVFVRDLVAGTTKRVSVATGGAAANGDAGDPSISLNGRFVAFWSTATNLVAGDNNGAGDVFVRDLSTGTTKLASVSTAGGPGNGLSSFPAITSDGRYVTFESNASNLTRGDTNGSSDVFVRDLLNGTTFLASKTTAKTPANGSSSQAAISGNGAYVSMSSTASNLTPDANGAVGDIIRVRVLP